MALSRAEWGGSWATATTIQAYSNEQVIITPYDTTTRNGSHILDFNNDRSWIIIDGLILDGLNQYGGKGGATGVHLSYNGHHFRISNTEVRYTGGMGIGTANAHSNEFINLHIHHANHKLAASDPNYEKNVYGIYLESGNNLIMGCDIHHNRGYGVHNYSGQAYKPNNNIYINNTVHHNELSGFMIATSTGVKLINNLSYENGTGASTGYTGWNRYGIQINWSVSDVTVFHNTTYYNPQGELELGPSSSKVRVSNNILAGHGIRDVLFLYKGSMNSVIENNLIVGSGTDSTIWVRNLEPSATLKANLIGKQYKPSFKSAQNHDFHLTADSSARGMGLVLNEVETDFDGITRTQATGLIGAYGFDIGAYQYR